VGREKSGVTSTWNPSVITNTYDGDGQLTKQFEAVGTDHWDAYFIRSTVLNGEVVLWKEVQTNPYYAPGWSNTIQYGSIYAKGERIAQVYNGTGFNGQVTFEFGEPFTGTRRGVVVDPLDQEVGSYDPGPDDPGDVGSYPEQHEFGNVEDMNLGCTLDGITIDCATRNRFMNMGALATRWDEVHPNGTIQPRQAPIIPLGLGLFRAWAPDNARGNDRQYSPFLFWARGSVQPGGEQLSECLRNALRQYFPQQSAQGKSYSPVDDARFKSGIPTPFNWGGTIPGTVYPGAITLGLYDIHYDPTFLKSLTSGSSEDLKTILEEVSHTIQFLQVWNGLKKNMMAMGKWGIDTTDYSHAMSAWQSHAAYYWAKAGGSYDDSEVEIWAKNNANRILEKLVNDPKYKKEGKVCGFDLRTYTIVIR
jgi:hypothetical protein